MYICELIHATAVLKTILEFLNCFETFENLNQNYYEFYKKVFKKLESKYFLRNGGLLEINEEAEKELEEIFQKTKDEVLKKLENLIKDVCKK